MKRSGHEAMSKTKNRKRKIKTKSNSKNNFHAEKEEDPLEVSLSNTFFVEVEEAKSSSSKHKVLTPIKDMAVNIPQLPAYLNLELKVHSIDMFSLRTFTTEDVRRFITR